MSILRRLRSRFGEPVEGLEFGPRIRSGWLSMGIILALTTALAWAHEGKLQGSTHTQIKRVQGRLSASYEISFLGSAAGEEWHELDENGDGQASEEEKRAYLEREKKWFEGAWTALRPSQTRVLEASASRVVLQAQLEGQGESLSHRGIEDFSGLHRYELSLDTAASVHWTAQPLPQLSWQNRSEGAPFRGNWSLDTGGLSAGLRGKSWWGGFLLAFGLGALHGLTPGHGKTIVGAYLIGSRGTIWHAILLGLVVTLTHTSSVVVLGLLCLLAFKNYLPPTLIPWVGVVSGILIAGLGFAMLGGAWDHDHDHGHDHSHGHSHGPFGHHHHHAPIPEKLSLKGLISLGISGGMVPCPEALAVLLSALALNQLALGMWILLAFSAGLAAILVAIGIAMVCFARMFEKRYPSDERIKNISKVSYLGMVVLGIVMAARSLWQTL